jgi:mannose-6-phosphate isomerase-like protein (cupin superfamily)
MSDRKVGRSEDKPQESEGVSGSSELNWRVDKPQSPIHSMTAKRANIFRVKEWFKVLATTKRTQTAVMKLGVGQSTGDEPEAHEGSEQILLLVEGELSGEVRGRHLRMKPGDFIVIPPRVKHKFTNGGKIPVITFNVYSPPEYPPDEES